MLDVYANRQVSFWRTVVLTFPFMLFVAFATIWIYSSFKQTWNVSFLAHVSWLSLALLGITLALNEFALLPVQYAYQGDWWSPSDWRMNLLLLLRSYLHAYQPLNFVLATASGVYWGAIIIRRIGSE